MLELDISTLERLRRIGLAPALQETLETLSGQLAPDDTLCRVVEVQREGVALHDGHAEWPARLLPALRAELAARDDALAVGEWVVASADVWQGWWVRARIPPLNQLARRQHQERKHSDGRVTRTVIVSNVDTALLVMGLDHDFNLRRLERYLALVRMAGVRAAVVLTKADLCDEPGARLDAVKRMLPADVEAVCVNALEASAAQPLRPWLQPGHTLVLLGSSGAGKSTLTNLLTGDAIQETGGTRAGDGRGRHTTTARSLHATPQGACIIDTPGLRTLRLDGDADALDGAFDDIAKLALQCRFADCRHHAEPGCAVRDGVGSERLRNYQKLQREAERDSLSFLQRRARVSEWKARGREGRMRMEAKRGGRP